MRCDCVYIFALDLGAQLLGLSWRCCLSCHSHFETYTFFSFRLRTFRACYSQTTSKFIPKQDQLLYIAIIYLPIYVSLCLCFEVLLIFVIVSNYASLWQVCLAGIAVIVTLFTVAAPRADPLIGLVAAWALLGIFVELENPENLMNPNKFNFIDWPHFVTEAVRPTALVLSIASACAALIAVGRTTWDWNMGRAEKSLTRDHATAEI